MIKSFRYNLIKWYSPNIDNITNEEKLARKLYEKETEIIQDNDKEWLSFNNMQIWNNYQMMTKEYYWLNTNVEWKQLYITKHFIMLS